MGPLKKGPVHIAESMRMFIVWEEEEWKQIGTLLNGHGVKESVPLVFGLKAMGSTGVHVAQLGAQSGAHASRPVSPCSLRFSDLIAGPRGRRASHNNFHKSACAMAAMTTTAVFSVYRRRRLCSHCAHHVFPTGAFPFLSAIAFPVDLSPCVYSILIVSNFFNTSLISSFGILGGMENCGSCWDWTMSLDSAVELLDSVVER